MKINVTITPEILQLIGSIDEFKGRWQALRAIDREANSAKYPPLSIHESPSEHLTQKVNFLAPAKALRDGDGARTPKP